MLSRLLNRARRIEFEIIPVSNGKDMSVMVHAHPGIGSPATSFPITTSEATLNSCGFELGQYYQVSNHSIRKGHRLVLENSKMGSYYRNPKLRHSRPIFLCTTALTTLFGRFPKRIYFKEVPHEQA